MSIPENAVQNDRYGHSYEYTIRPAQEDDLPRLPAIEHSASSAFLKPSDPDLALIADDEPVSADAHREHINSWVSHPVVRGFKSGGVTEPGIGTGTWVAVAYHTPTTSRCTGTEAEAEGEGNVVGFIVTSLLEVYHDEDQHKVGNTDADQLDTGTGKYFIHIHEVSVHVAHQRRGLAKRLINAVKECTLRIAGAYEDIDTAEKGVGQDDRTTDATRVQIKGLSLTTFRDVAFNAPFYEKLGFEVIAVERIKEVMGEDGWVIWEEERERFSEIGDGRLAERRCWMICHLGH